MLTAKNWRLVSRTPVHSSKLELCTSYSNKAAHHPDIEISGLLNKKVHEDNLQHRSKYTVNIVCYLRF